MFRQPREVDKPTYEVVGEIKRFDQRDHVNARQCMIPGSPEYEEYYSRHPERKEWDEENRAIWTASLKRHLEKDPIGSHLVPSVFYGRRVLGLSSIVEGQSSGGVWGGAGSSKPVDAEPGRMAKLIKGYGSYLGAFRVRIARLRKEWVLTNYASPYTPEPNGKEVSLEYPYIIAMAFPQDNRMLRVGVGPGMEVEVGWKYAYASLVSVIMAHFIRCTGWRARALPPENSPYLVVPAFVDAGIGEQGRCGFVVTKEYGNNFRPGAVATDMPMALDRPVDFGVQDFCEKCMICADECPSGAIPSGGRVVIGGVRRWKVDDDKCRRFWNHVGGSCGICQTVCPWNHPSNLFHDTIREFAENVPSLRRLLIWGEKAAYGKFKAAKPPEWMTLFQK